MIGQLSAMFAGIVTVLALLAGWLGLLGDRDVAATFVAAGVGCLVFLAGCWLADRMVGGDT